MLLPAKDVEATGGDGSAWWYGVGGPQTGMRARFCVR